jgi:type II secretory pathway pseudopilin PulG
MRSPQTLRDSSQRGAALLILLMILVVGVMAVLLKGFNNRSLQFRQNTATISALAKAKEALISYAVMYADNYPPTDAGPGHLMCPDTNNDGLPDSPCAPNAIGRLPRSITLPSGTLFPVSDQDSGIDQQFWYALTDAFRNSPAGVVNSSTLGSLTLDGQGDVVAVIIAPGSSLSGQNRPSTNGTDYLEAGNAGGPAFVTAASGEFNDRVLAVRRSEMMPMITVRVAEEIRKHLDAYHLTNGVYPADSSSFASALSTAPQWFTANQWLSVTTYTRISGDKATLRFSACGITYSLTYGGTGIGRSQTHC